MQKACPYVLIDGDSNVFVVIDHAKTFLEKNTRMRTSQPNAERERGDLRRVHCKQFAVVFLWFQTYS